MDALRFLTIREGLGMSRYDVVKRYDVKDKTVREWERGSMSIPPGVVEDLTSQLNDFLRTIDNMSTDAPVVDGSTREGRALAWAALIAYDKVTIEGKAA